MSDACPNIQNFTPRTQEVARIRRVLEEQIKLVEVDYSEIERRILAYYAEKQNG